MGTVPDRREAQQWRPRNERPPREEPRRRRAPRRAVGPQQFFAPERGMGTAEQNGLDDDSFAFPKERRSADRRGCTYARIAGSIRSKESPTVNATRRGGASCSCPQVRHRGRSRRLARALRGRQSPQALDGSAAKAARRNAIGGCFGPEMKSTAATRFRPRSHVDEARQQLAQERMDLDAGDVGAETEVRTAAPERHVFVRCARQVEDVRRSVRTRPGSRLAEP